MGTATCNKAVTRTVNISDNGQLASNFSLPEWLRLEHRGSRLEAHELPVHAKTRAIHGTRPQDQERDLRESHDDRPAVGTEWVPLLPRCQSTSSGVTQRQQAAECPLPIPRGRCGIGFDVASMCHRGSDCKNCRHNAAATFLLGWAVSSRIADRGNTYSCPGVPQFPSRRRVAAHLPSMKSLQSRHLERRARPDDLGCTQPECTSPKTGLALTPCRSQQYMCRGWA